MAAVTTTNTAALLNTQFGRIERHNNTFPVLTNAFHPIMAKARTDLLAQSRPGFQIQARALDPALRLTSHFLECGALDSYFYIFHDPKVLQRWKDNRQQYDVFPAAHCSATRIISAAAKRSVQRRLRLVANHVNFRVDDQGVVGDGVRTEEIYVRVTAGGGLGQQSQPVRYGYQSTVTIARSTYDELEQTTRANVTDVPRQLAVHFEFAVSLIHEMTHVYRNFNMGVYSRLDHVGEPFLGRALISELGFDLEDRLLGGHITLVRPENRDVRVYRISNNARSNLLGVLSVIEWPCQDVVYGYEENSTARDPNFMLKRQDPMDFRPLDQAWRIELADVERLFQDNFWNTIYPPNSNQRDFLWPRKSWGFNFKARKARARGYQPVTSSNDEAKYVPIGYARDANGDLRPNGGGAVARSVAYAQTQAVSRRSGRVGTLRAWEMVRPHPGRSAS